MTRAWPVVILTKRKGLIQRRARQSGRRHQGGDQEEDDDSADGYDVTHATGLFARVRMRCPSDRRHRAVEQYSSSDGVAIAEAGTHRREVATPTYADAPTG